MLEGRADGGGWRASGGDVQSVCVVAIEQGVQLCSSEI